MEIKKATINESKTQEKRVTYEDHKITNVLRNARD